ncbi:hypothetical protein KAU11_12380 [Candidatus Babeliales bacterium]|nr:hypothetical protein [Candidatus Babeliales bacterium]
MEDRYQQAKETREFSFTCVSTPKITYKKGMLILNQMHFEGLISTKEKKEKVSKWVRKFID